MQSKQEERRDNQFKMFAGPIGGANAAQQIQ